MKTRTACILSLCGLLAAIALLPSPAAGAADEACSADRALALVRAADEAAGAQHWREAYSAYARAEQALRDLTARCPGRLADRAETLLSSLPASRAVVEAGLDRTVCQPASRRARELDEQATARQGEKKDWSGVAKLFGEAEAAWGEAAEACRGDNRQAALAARAESARGRARAADQLEQPSCRTSFAEAGRLKASARSAWEAGRWQESASRYREAERAWTAAQAECTGSRRIHAGKESQVSLAEAEEAARCGPSWSRAVELGERFKQLPLTASTEARMAWHHRLEIYWGQAADTCRGRPAEIARAQAQSLAGERGNLPLPLLSSLPEPKEIDAAPLPAGEIPEMSVRVGDTRYSGRFRRDASNLTLSGQGRVEWDNGNVFVGSLVLGKAEGQGSMVWRNGDRYDGQWRFDLPHGQGSMNFSNGSRYEGEFVAGKPEGVGRFSYGGSGDHYEGEFRDGQPEGWGSFRWKTGDRFEGSWKDGHKNGPGRQVWPSGEFEEGWYENDRPVPPPPGTGRE